MTYKQITDLDGLDLFHAQVAQNKLESVPRPGLDPEHETTKALPPERRLKYRRVTKKDAEEVANVESCARGSKEEPSETGVTTEEEEATKKTLSLVRKASNGFNNTAIDFKIKLGKYVGNQYRSRTIEFDLLMRCCCSFQTFSDFFRFVQTFSDFFRLVQTSPDWRSLKKSEKV